MRKIHLLLATATIYLCLPAAECVFEKTIESFLKELSVRMCHPIPNLGLPALDPLTVNHAETAMDNKYLIDFTGSIDNFKVHGLSDFVINKLSINIVPGVTRSTINVTFPYTYLKSIYTAKGSLAYILNLAGDGNAETTITDFNFEISWRIKASIGPLAITALKIDMLLGDLKINFDNLLEEERINNFVHALVNEMGVELLGDIWNYEQPTAIDKVETIINSKLPDLLKLITGGNGGEGPPVFDGVEPDCKSEIGN
ncbi:uncharacterized protein LOC108601997 [Drosophila busckii]|uniref:uncharacterized protein LOC108601997 n=1 Tax=Drosophila busckii TaxID=30019 RepID=UPI00083EC7EC|nr:uncharacterized protein LOC108601997 [Drosophila busckii]